MKLVSLKKDWHTILGEALLWFSAIVFLVVCFAAVAAYNPDDARYLAMMDRNCSYVKIRRKRENSRA